MVIDEDVFNIKELLEFSQSHRVIVLRGWDDLYRCYVDANMEEWSAEPDFFSALAYGVYKYNTTFKII